MRGGAIGWGESILSSSRLAVFSVERAVLDDQEKGQVVIAVFALRVGDGELLIESDHGLVIYSASFVIQVARSLGGNAHDLLHFFDSIFELLGTLLLALSVMGLGDELALEVLDLAFVFSPEKAGVGFEAVELEGVVFDGVKDLSRDDLVSDVGVALFLESLGCGRVGISGSGDRELEGHGLVFPIVLQSLPQFLSKDLGFFGGQLGALAFDLDAKVEKLF